MLYKSEIILSQHTHNFDSSREWVYGDPYPGDAYYGKSDGLHTVQYALHQFIGVIAIHATLCFEPEFDDWFTVVEHEYEDILPTQEYITGYDNFIGNYVWVRAVLKNWQYGTVLSIRLNR